MLNEFQEKLCQISIRFSRLRTPILLFSMVALGYGLYVSLYPDVGSNNQQILPAILVFSWCLLIFCLLTVFAIPVHESNEGEGYFRRNLTKVKNFIRAVLFASFVILTLALLFVSYKLMMTGIG